MTNRAWLERMTDEQLAKFICDVIGPEPTYESAFRVCKRKRKELEKWLKRNRD